MISTVMKLYFKRVDPKAKYYGDYSKFHIDYFRSVLYRQLDSTFCCIKENDNCEEPYEFSQFHRISL